MTEKQAIRKATQMAKKRQDIQYVVLEETNPLEYAWAEEHELYEWFQGCRVIYAIHPDGFIEH